MFKNRAFQVKMVNTNEGEPIDTAFPHIAITKQDVTDVTDNLIKKSTLAVISIIAAAAVAHTASEIAIHHGTKK